MAEILVLILAILYFYFCRAVYRKVRRKTEKMWIRAVTIVLLFFLGFGDNIIGNAVFYYLVWKKGGERIYQKVDSVPGFMLETDYGGMIHYFMKSLFSDKYKFVEQHVTEDMHPRALNYWPYAREKGYYRLYISKPNDNNCKDYIADYAKYNEKPPYPADKCMAYEKIESPQSKYSVEFGQKKKFSETYIHIALHTTTIKEIGTNKVIAESNIIYYAGGWIMHALLEYRQAKTYPENEDKIYDSTNFIHEVLKPI